MNREKRTEIRGDRKSHLLGTLAGWLMRLWSLTLRVSISDEAGLTGTTPPAGPLIFVLWHNQIFCLPPVWWRAVGKQRKATVLTSASKDGAVVAAAMAELGMDAVRGSSSRRGLAALIAMKRALEKGRDVCITPDGPRGPRYRCQPGTVKLAQATGAPVVVCSLICTSAWRLKTWDRLVIPKPFSRVRMILACPHQVPPTLEGTSFESERRRLEAEMLRHADQPDNTP